MNSVGLHLEVVPLHVLQSPYSLREKLLMLDFDFYWLTGGDLIRTADPFVFSTGFLVYSSFFRDPGANHLKPHASHQL